MGKGISTSSSSGTMPLRLLEPSYVFRMALLLSALMIHLFGKSGITHAADPTGTVTTFNGMPMYTLNSEANLDPFLEPTVVHTSSNPLASSVLFIQNEANKLRPTLLEDIASSALWASDSWWKNGDIEKRFQTAIYNFSIKNGYYATSEDSPRSPRPSRYTDESEVAFRAEMARSLKHYMLVRGIPKLLASREETRELGEKYEKTYQAIATAATVQVVTRNKWSFRSGVNPFNMRGWIAYSNPQWNYELNTRLGNFHTEIFVQRSFKRGYSSEIRYRTADAHLISTVSKVITPTLNVYAVNDTPVKVVSAMYSGVGLNHAF